jgi:hypothetical protein
MSINQNELESKSYDGLFVPFTTNLPIELAEQVAVAYAIYKIIPGIPISEGNWNEINSAEQELSNYSRKLRLPFGPFGRFFWRVSRNGADYHASTPSA